MGEKPKIFIEASSEGKVVLKVGDNVIFDLSPKAARSFAKDLNDMAGIAEALIPRPSPVNLVGPGCSIQQ